MRRATTRGSAARATQGEGRARTAAAHAACSPEEPCRGGGRGSAGFGWQRAARGGGGRLRQKSAPHQGRGALLNARAPSVNDPPSPSEGGRPWEGGVAVGKPAHGPPPPPRLARGSAPANKAGAGRNSGRGVCQHFNGTYCGVPCRLSCAHARPSMQPLHSPALARSARGLWCLSGSLEATWRGGANE